MHIFQHISRRPAPVLAVAIAVTLLLATMACGSTAAPEPVAAPAAPTESHSTTENGSETSHSRDGDTGHQAEASARPTADADAVVINLPIADRTTTLTRDDLQVKKGDTVSISFTADEAGEIHLHGYDLTAPVSPGSPGALEFVADTAGAFGINFHVFAADAMDGDVAVDGDHHAADAPARVISDAPLSVTISAEPDDAGGVNVRIATEGFRFAPELVDQEHTPGAGHAHIYLNGEKLGRVFESEYHIAVVPPGEHEVRVSLNTNDHGELVFDGRKVEATATVNVPDVGQGHGDADRDAGQERDGHDHDGSDHDDHDHGEHEVVAEVHLGNLEVYP